MRSLELVRSGLAPSRVRLIPLVVAVLAGCGDDNQTKVTIIGDDAVDASDDALVGPCQTGDQSCEGQTPATCVDGAWVLAEEACTGALPWCLDGACVACSPGLVGCGANTPRTCAADGSWVYGDPCSASTPLCLDGACVQCSPGDERCHPTGTSTETCNDLGEWVTAIACDFGCSDARCSGDCVPLSGKCELSVPSTCDTTGTWIATDACGGDTPLCLDGKCVVCTPGEVDCDGQDSRTCNKFGFWETTETCEFACVDGVCQGVCVPGTVGCDGRVPETCDALGAWIPAVSECAYGCAAGECVGECRPNTLRCFGDAPATCGEDLIWDTGALCEQPSPDCDLGVCGCRADKTLCKEGTECVNLQTDPRNCGTCGHDCLGGTCEAGACRPVVLATGQSPGTLVVDDTHVYWTVYGNGAQNAGAIRSIPKAGGVISIVASDLTAPLVLAASDTDLYWTTGPSGNVQTIPKAGGNLRNVATALNAPFGVAYGDETLFVTSSNAAAVYSVPISGGTVTTRAITQPTALAVAVDGDWVYWTNAYFGSTNATVMRQAIDGLSAPEVFAASQTRPSALAFDDTYVYWTAWNGNGADVIRRCPKTGCVGEPTVVIGGLQLAGGTNATCITVDDTHVYWTNAGTGAVQRVPKGGGTPTILATNQAGVNCVQDDETAIYWTTFSGGGIVRLAK
jgi:hypothetical protein